MYYYRALRCTRNCCLYLPYVLLVTLSLSIAIKIVLWIQGLPEDHNEKMGINAWTGLSLSAAWMLPVAEFFLKPIHILPDIFIVPWIVLFFIAMIPALMMVFSSLVIFATLGIVNAFEYLLSFRIGSLMVLALIISALYLPLHSRFIKWKESCRRPLRKENQLLHNLLSEFLQDNVTTSRDVAGIILEYTQ